MRTKTVGHFVAVFLAGLFFLETASTTEAGERSSSPRSVQFNRDVRPILSERCFACHGPDKQKRKADLRLDVAAVALAPRDGRPAIVPHDPVKSELYRRITAQSVEDRMPPRKTGMTLSERQIETLRRWIEEGAEYEGHWSFIPPKRPPLPGVKNATWPRNDMDYFILSRLEKEGLFPSREADRAALIRRVTLDLTGLPPTLAEVDAFLEDAAEDAYEKVVERLLSSPRYGERMAVDWLDAARYADTHGYHIDSGRDMWPWRKWVIDAFNRNLPFDRFTVEQLAGDLLPNATMDQKVASGFNRNHMINFEGGAIPEEYQVAYIVDRINTTSTVWLGLTLACTQCHDHKFDPFTQKEYYQLYAFFHNVPENGLDGQKGNAAPLIKLPTDAERGELDRISASIRQIEERLRGPIPSVDADEARWEETAAAEAETLWAPLDPSDLRATGGARLAKGADRSIIASGENPARDTYTIVAPVGPGEVTALRLEALPDDSFPSKGPGRSQNGNIVLTDVRLSLLEGSERPLKLKKASADFSQKDYPVQNAIDDRPETGWALSPEVGRRHFAVFEVGEPVHGNEASFLRVTLDFQSPFAQHQLGRFRLSVTSAKDPHGERTLPANIRQILALLPEKRGEQQRAELRDHYRKSFSVELKPLYEEIDKLRNSQAELDKKIPTTMVMEEMPKPRETFMLVRGQYDKKGEKVAAGVPASLPPLPGGAPLNRLGLARWLVDPSHPLTARVIVNRYWQMYFGAGLVKTAEDFGSQGEWPSHPELLDWLATELIGSGWDLKGLQRLIVTSATYRQSSAATPELLERDPENRLLARGSRLRLQAEFIRDQALALGGLLDSRIGGPSVSPYQPPGLWEELASREDGASWTAQVYKQSHGQDLYRRTLYTFWKRTSPPPTLQTFDAPDRETCTVRRARTNTPLQALILMNDPTYVEASRKLAERMMTEAPSSAEEKITFAFRLATARRPSEAELGLLKRAFDQQLLAYRNDSEAAVKLLSVGESKRNENLDAAELASWATVASMILNLDETVTKG
jgi:hypothetical protein